MQERLKLIFESLRKIYPDLLTLADFFELLSLIDNPVYLSMGIPTLDVIKFMWIKQGVSVDVFDRLLEKEFNSSLVEQGGISIDINKEFEAGTNTEKRETSGEDLTKNNNYHPVDEPDDRIESPDAGFFYFDSNKGSKNFDYKIEVNIKQNQNQFIFPIYNLYPISNRNLQQAWKSLANQQLKLKNQQHNIDVECMVENIARQEMVTEIKYYREKDWLNNLIMIVETHFEMDAFEPLIYELVESARKVFNNRLSVFYNYGKIPDEFVYKDKKLSDPILLKELFESYSGNYTSLIWIGAAGAISGTWVPDEIKSFFNYKREYIDKCISKFAWLNPVPEDRWRLTSAEDISRFIPMAHADVQGLWKVIPFLKGSEKYEFIH